MQFFRNRSNTWYNAQGSLQGSLLGRMEQVTEIRCEDFENDVKQWVETGKEGNIWWNPLQAHVNVEEQSLSQL